MISFNRCITHWYFEIQTFQYNHGEVTKKEIYANIISWALVMYYKSILVQIGIEMNKSCKNKTRSCNTILFDRKWNPR